MFLSYQFRKKIKHLIVGTIRVGIWEQYKLIYIRVPKSGSTSILSAHNSTNNEHRCLESRLSVKQITRLDDSWTTFSFVRNPWARLVSTYIQKASTEATSNQMVGGVYEGFINNGIPISPGMSFEEFCRVACDIPDAETDKHIRSQSYTLIYDGKPITPYIGRLETISEDWQSLMHKTGLNLELPHCNCTNTQGRHYSSFYTNEALINKVADRYADDIAYFNYDFERPK